MLENIISRLKKKQNDQKAMSILTNIYVNIIKICVNVSLLFYDSAANVMSS